MVPTANIILSNPTIGPTNLNPENWLQKVIQIPILLVFFPNCDFLPTVFCITKMEAECGRWWIILVSVIPAYFAYSVTLPTFPSQSPISSECESCLIVPTANIIPSDPTLAPTNPNQENWLQKIIQIPILIVFFPNCDSLPTVFCITKMEAECGRWWIILVSVIPAYFAYSDLTYFS